MRIQRNEREETGRELERERRVYREGESEVKTEDRRAISEEKREIEKQRKKGGKRVKGKWVEKIKRK